MLASVALNGSLGFAIVTATLFGLGDEQEALNSSTGFPFMQVFVNATNSKAGATAMVCVDSIAQGFRVQAVRSADCWQTSIIIAAMVFAAVGYLATASRMLWAFAREEGLPGSSVLARVCALSMVENPGIADWPRWNLAPCFPYTASDCRLSSALHSR